MSEMNPNHVMLPWLRAARPPVLTISFVCFVAAGLGVEAAGPVGMTLFVLYWGLAVPACFVVDLAIDARRSKR